MEVLHPCCSGLDVHKKSITACVLWAEAKAKARRRNGGSGRIRKTWSDWRHGFRKAA